MNRALVTLAAAVAILTARGAARAATCADFLASNVYTCHIKSDFGSDFTDCFRFTSPGVVSENFDLAVDGLGQTLGCDCQTGGSVATPKFGNSKGFHCVAQSGDPLGIYFSGKASSNKIKKGQAVNQGGNSFIYDCVLNPACPALSTGSNPPSYGK
jgi:hypothetical protein